MQAVTELEKQMPQGEMPFEKQQLFCRGRIKQIIKGRVIMNAVSSSDLFYF